MCFLQRIDIIILYRSHILNNKFLFASFHWKLDLKAHVCVYFRKIYIYTVICIYIMK